MACDFYDTALGDRGEVCTLSLINPFPA
jgi:hypothetical protein